MNGAIISPPPFDGEPQGNGARHHRQQQVILMLAEQAHPARRRDAQVIHAMKYNRIVLIVKYFSARHLIDEVSAT
jgi:hypothetical protein